MVITGFQHQLDDYTFTHNGTGCHGAYCYSNDIVYNATVEQMELIKDNSLYCDQQIDIGCYYVSLTGLSGWSDVNNNMHTYWHGSSDSPSNGCRCAENTSCLKQDSVCNCDAKESIVLRDTNNVLTDTEALPVSRVHFGDDFNGILQYKLGMFQCYNEAPPVSSTAAAFSYGLNECDNDVFQGQGVVPVNHAFYDSINANLESASYTVDEPGVYYITVQMSAGKVNYIFDEWWRLNL